MTGQGRRNLAKGLAFCSPWIVGFLLFTFLPLILSLYYSFSHFSLIHRNDPVWAGIENYVDLFGDEVFWLALKNTFAYALIALPMGIIISLSLALLLNQPIKGQPIYRTLIFLPSLVPAVASAMLWMWIFNARLGLINVALDRIGIEGPPWLSSTRWAMPALILMSFWGVGHSVVIYLAGLQDVPRELYEAADIDGATSWQRLRHVTLPMISPVVFFNLIMAIIGSLQTFATPYIMTAGGPARATYFFTMYLYDKAFNYLEMGYASAMAWIQLLIVLALTALAFWTSKRWVHYQGK